MHALFFSLLGLRTFFSRIIFLVGKDLFSSAADLPTIGCSPLKQEVWVGGCLVAAGLAVAVAEEFQAGVVARRRTASARAFRPDVIGSRGGRDGSRGRCGGRRHLLHVAPELSTAVTFGTLGCVG